MYQPHKGHRDGSSWCLPGCPVWEAAKKKEQLEVFFLRQDIEELFEKCLKNKPTFPPNPIP